MTTDTTAPLIRTWDDLIGRSLLYIESIPTRDAAAALLAQADAPGAVPHRKWRATLAALVSAYDLGAALGRPGAWVARRTLRWLDGSRIVDIGGSPMAITLRAPRGATAPARWVIGIGTDGPRPADDAGALRRAGYVAVLAGGHDRAWSVSPRGVHAVHRT